MHDALLMLRINNKGTRKSPESNHAIIITTDGGQRETPVIIRRWTKLFACMKCSCKAQRPCKLMRRFQQISSSMK